MLAVTVNDVLLARDKRREKQQELLATYQKPLLCFTMNIPGEYKISPLIEFAFHKGIQVLKKKVGSFLYEETISSPAGYEFYGVSSLSAQELKEVAMEVENVEGIGRLFDMDVLSEQGDKLSRNTPRTCLICGGPATVCSRSRAHGLEALKETTNQLLSSFAAKQMAEAAVNALKAEVHLTPKPGLVDERNQGAHEDMDVALFEKSADSLQSYFETAFLLGIQSARCMESLQKAGQEAEKTMYQATCGVNTHKGAIYGFGLLLAALGSTFVREDSLFHRAALLAKDGKPNSSPSHGATVREKYQIPGARDEAEAGFPHVKEAFTLLKDGKSPLSVLLHLYLTCPDTNLYYRGGSEGVAFVKSEVEAILQKGESQWIPLLEKLDQEMIERHLSPGGCADILAMALFLYSVQ